MTETADRRLSTAVLDAVEAHDQTDATVDGDPLYDAVDPDALDALFNKSPGAVVFEFRGYVVRVNSDHDVDLTVAKQA